MKYLLALIAFTNPAWAACNSGERTFMSCSFDNGKAVQVCMDDEQVRYSFGRPGQTPELALSLRFGEGAEAVPWPGVGRSIWEAVRLTNNDVIYEVYAGFDRFAAIEDSPEYKENPKFGGITILDAQGEFITDLECIPSTVDYAF